jgi:hypothetical protein
MFGQTKLTHAGHLFDSQTKKVKLPAILQAFPPHRSIFEAMTA